MSLRKVLSVSFLALAMTGCKYFSADGRLVVQEPLQVVARVGAFGKTEVRVIPVGQFTANFSISSESRAELTFIQGSKKIRIPMTINEKKIPEQGAFVLTSQDLKQPFSLRGNLSKKQNVGPEISGFEFCQTTRPVYDCWENRRTHQTECGYVDRLVSGERFVRYYELTTLRLLKANILGVKKARALFSGTDQQVEKVYLQKGTCLAN